MADELRHDITYDDSQLRAMFEDLQPKHRVKALKSAVRRGGNMVKKAAVGVLRSKIHSTPSLEKGIRVLTFKKSVGFRVTIGSVKGKKMQRLMSITDAKTGKKITKNPSQDRSYILRIFEAFGGEERKHRTGKKSSTGIIQQVRFMEQAQAEAAGSVNEEIQKAFITNIQKIAAKNGAKCN